MTIERTLEATYENHRADIARREADYARELNAKLGQINAQAKTIKVLTHALQKIAGDGVRGSDIGWEGCCHPGIAQDVLRDVIPYPLPTGRTR